MSINLRKFCYAGKCYDPLVINNRECYSYIFNLDNGGRTHKVNSLQELEEQFMDETIRELKS